MRSLKEAIKYKRQDSNNKITKTKFKKERDVQNVERKGI